ncbi:hypothetical protein [Streptomyces sp. HB2AG]|uniref:hypothetical protein n=1 Tax=Streptomyces sp. HB2AG TaxID=2983400 RepID=UPI0022AA4018|nr:hypothetical protein [Streptomyces sp. HB2AG]MCZ2527993.1 hypothetical protein [Streptomyces sp. HB2AG]
MALRTDRSENRGGGARTGTGAGSALRGRLGSLWPRVDPDQGDPDLARLRVAAGAADWPALLDGLSAVEDGPDRTWLIAVVTDRRGMQEWLPAAVVARPESALPLLVSGARLVSWAWEARTGARARDVSAEQFKVFHQRLRDAEEQLYEVAEREPGWLAPWYFLQISGRGLQVGPEAALARFEAAVRRCPDHLGSHQQRLQQLCRKWGGSHEEMHAFARSSMLSSAPGSPLGTLVATAHLEEWLDRCDGEGDAAAGRYMRRPDVVAQLHEAAEHSVLHPDYPWPRSWAGNFNTFAMAFALAGEKAAASRMFKILGGTVTEFPWQYAGGVPSMVFRSWRARSRTWSRS